MPSIANIPVEDEEFLARFVLKEKWKRRKSDGTLPYEAFLPYRRVELSVSRIRGLTDRRLWGAGRCAAVKRNRNNRPNGERIGLFGRFDLKAKSIREVGLRIEPSEGPNKGPLNHCNLTGYPAEKAAQQIIAQKLAECAEAVNMPPEQVGAVGH